MERRTYHGVMPKSIYYRTDGSGRDTYISYDNGGCFQPMSKLRSQKGLLIRPKTPVSQSSLKSLHYVSDGSGRDTYVQIGDGGLHARTSAEHFLANFRNSLRGYQPIKYPSDPYTWTQSSWKSFQGRCNSRQANRKIKECVNRLYLSNK
jgi:hypothetical protein